MSLLENLHHLHFSPCLGPSSSSSTMHFLIHCYFLSLSPSLFLDVLVSSRSCLLSLPRIHNLVLSPLLKKKGERKCMLVTPPPHTHTQKTEYFLSIPSQLICFYPSPSAKQSGSCPRYTRCVPLVTCSPYYAEIAPNAYSLTCPLYSGAAGVCCPDIDKPGEARRRGSVFTEVFTKSLGV